MLPAVTAEPVIVASPSYSLFKILYHFTAHSEPFTAFSMYNVFCDFTAGRACLFPETSMLPLFENENYAIYHAFFFCLAARKLRAKLCTQSSPANCFWYTLFLIFTFNSFFFLNKHFLLCFLLIEALTIFGKRCSSNKQIKL